MSLKIDWATHQAAKYACENWHYSECLPTGKLVKIGAWEDEKFIGVVIFSRGASPSLLTAYKLQQTEGCELTRVALTTHKSPVSRILSLAIKFLRKANPGMRLIVSFADADQGHHGGIYQATNWIYSGTSAPKFEYLDKSGRTWHSRQVTDSGFVVEFGRRKRCLKRVDCTKVYLQGKYRYLMPLDDKMREQVKSLAKPYPKRAGSKANVATEFHSVEDGATPISALHSEVSNG